MPLAPGGPEPSAKRALPFTDCSPGHAVKTPRVLFGSAAANGPASAAPAKQACQIPSSPDHGPAPRHSPRRAQDSDDVGYDYGAATDFLCKYRLSQPPNLPTRANDNGDMCYELYKILTKGTLPPGSLARAQSGRIEYKRAMKLYSQHPGVISKKQAAQAGRQPAAQKKNGGDRGS